MPKYDYAASSGYDQDHHIMKQDADTFTIVDPVSKQNVTVPKNQGVGSKLYEGFALSDQAGQLANKVRKAKGWQTSGQDE